MLKNFCHAALAVLILSIAFSMNVRAESIVNGDFENTAGWGTYGTLNYPANWGDALNTMYRNAAVQQSSPVISGAVSAFMPANPSSSDEHIRQVLGSVDRVHDWVFEFDFASEDPGGKDDRSLNFCFALDNDFFYHTNIRIVDVDSDGDGDLQFYDNVYSSKTWHTVLKDCVQFDADVESSISVHHMKIVGNMDATIPTCDVYLTDSNGVVHTAMGVARYYKAVMVETAGRKFTAVHFATSASTGDYLIDNVSVHSATIPEPSALALLTAGLIGLLAYAWRKRK